MAILTNIVVLVATLAILPSLYFSSTDPFHILFRIAHTGLTLKHTYRPNITDTRNLTAEYKAFEDILRSRPVAPVSNSTDYVAETEKIRKKFIFGSLMPAVRGCSVEKHTYNINGEALTAYWVYGTSEQTKWEKTREQNFVMYLHGGAYTLGDIHSYKNFECELSKRLRYPVLHVEYSKAPEHPLPKCVNEVFGLYKVLLEQSNNVYKHMTVMGDSAGGGLSLLLLQKIISESLPVPQLAVVMSPWSDLSASGMSYQTNAELDIMIKIARVQYGIEQVFGGKELMQANKIDVKDPQYSPIYGSFKGFPRMLVHVGTGELLHSEGIDVYNKAKQAGVSVTLYEGEHLCHVYPLFFTVAPESEVALSQIVAYILKYTKQ